MSLIASQITSHSTDHFRASSGQQPGLYQSSAFRKFCEGSTPVTGGLPVKTAKMWKPFPCNGVIMISDIIKILEHLAMAADDL